MDPGFEQQLLRLQEWQVANTIAGYLGYGSEPRVTHLLQAAAAEGKNVLLPILQRDHDLTWARWDGDLDHLERHANLLQPHGPGTHEAIADADLILTPALAIDHRGHRLGQGGGSYDRAIMRATGVRTVALIYDHELVDELPTDAHDLSVSIAITPTQTVRFA